MDIWYRLAWAQLFEESLKGKAAVFNFEKDDTLLSYAFIKRRINDLSFARNLTETWYDTTTPYGYGGIYLSPAAHADKNFIRDAEQAWNRYCLENNIVAEFVRFHPLQKNHSYFKEYYSLEERNQNVYVDLTKPESQIDDEMNKHARHFKKAQHCNVIVEHDVAFQYLDVFKKFYQVTMDRNKAQNFYYFSSDFFDRLVQVLGQGIILLVGKVDNQIVSTFLFIVGEEDVYYFLSGSNAEALATCANHMIMRTMIFEAKKMGKKYFNLGGGLSTAPSDTIFRFKSGFSKTTTPFFTGSKIDNPEKYNEFVALSKMNALSTNFFPAYRAV